MKGLIRLIVGLAALGLALNHPGSEWLPMAHFIIGLTFVSGLIAFSREHC